MPNFVQGTAVSFPIYLRKSKKKKEKEPLIESSVIGFKGKQ